MVRVSCKSVKGSSAKGYNIFIPEEEYMRFIGIDLHNSNFLAVICDQFGKELKRYLIVIGDVKMFKSFLEQLTKEDYVAFETTTNSFWLYDQIKDRVKEIFVVNTYKFWGKKKSMKKTDYKDALEIAARLRYYVLYSKDERLFPTVHVPAKEVQELRSLFSTHDLLTKQKVMSKNRIRSLLVQQGICIKKEKIYTIEMKKRVLNLKMSTIARYQIATLYNQIADSERQIKELKEMIMIRGEYFKKEIDLLVSIKGVSVFIAIAIMADIADINRFETDKKLCAYLRSTPTIEESNETTKLGSVNKQSRKLAITMLMQGIHHAYKSSSYLDCLFSRVKGKKRKAGKARVAVARKIFQAIYHMLKKGEYFYWKDDKNHQTKMKTYENFLKKRNKMEKSA
jgi:transposase